MAAVCAVEGSTRASGRQGLSGGAGTGSTHCLLPCSGLLTGPQEGVEVSEH